MSIITKPHILKNKISNSKRSIELHEADWRHYQNILKDARTARKIRSLINENKEDIKEYELNLKWLLTLPMYAIGQIEEWKSDLQVLKKYMSGHDLEKYTYTIYKNMNDLVRNFYKGNLSNVFIA